MPERETVRHDDGVPSDDDRQSVLDALQRAVGAGRLTLAEFTDRVDVALAAETRTQIREALSEHPADAPIVGAITIFGDRRLELAAVPRVPQTPMVRVHGMTVFGDLRVRSLAPGESSSAWRRMVDRWRAAPSSAERPPPIRPRRALSAVSNRNRRH